MINSEKDGSEIKAKVLEITDKEIKYKNFDFQNGPTRYISISEVFMITYENGQKEVFSTQPPTEEIYYSLSSELKNEFDRIGSNDYQMLKFFEKNNFREYHNNFESACKMSETGFGILGGGLVLMGGGVFALVFGISDQNIGFIYAGSAMIGVGQVLTIVSIPFSAIGGVKKAAIKRNFVKKYFGTDGYSYQPTLNFGLITNAIGFSLKF